MLPAERPFGPGCMLMSKDRPHLCGCPGNWSKLREYGACAECISWTFSSPIWFCIIMATVSGRRILTPALDIDPAVEQLSDLQSNARVLGVVADHERLDTDEAALAAARDLGAVRHIVTFAGVALPAE